MRLVYMQGGALTIRWSWLPFWLAINPKMKDEVSTQLRDVALLNGVTTSEADLDAMSDWVARRFQAVFPGFPGLETYLRGISAVNPGG